MAAVPYLGPAAHTTPGPNLPINRIVIHCTVSPCVKGQARATARYFRSPTSTGSAHYVADPGEIVQVVSDKVIAWHAPPNQHSIGVELCDPMVGRDSRWANEDHRSMLAIAAREVAHLCAVYKVPVERIGVADLRAGKRGICGHVDVSQAFKQSSHWDPGPAFPWQHFMSAVRAFTTPAAPTEDDMTKAELTKALRDDKDPLTVALKGVVRSVVQSELRQEREGSNPGQVGA